MILHRRVAPLILALSCPFWSHGAIVVNGVSAQGFFPTPVMDTYASEALSTDLIQANSATLAQFTRDQAPLFETDTLNNGLIVDNAGTYFSATYQGGRLPTTYTYVLNTKTNLGGYRIQEIRSFAGWRSDGATLGNQRYEVQVRYVGSSNFVSLGTHQYVPFPSNGFYGTSATKMTLTEDVTGTLAIGVNAIRFIFQNHGQNQSVADGTVYLEMDVIGTPGTTVSVLQYFVNEATTLLNGAVVGTQTGEYPASAHSTFQNAILAAQSVVNSGTMVQGVLSDALNALKTASRTFREAVVGGLPFYHHVLSTGQSLAIGWNGAPALTTTQPYLNRQLDGPTQTGTSLIPMVEGGGQPANVESHNSAMVNTLTLLSPDQSYRSILSRIGQPSAAYSTLKKGTSTYNLGLTQIESAANVCQNLGVDYDVVAVTNVHGESDHITGLGSSYSGFLKEWRSDYSQDIRQITGQTSEVPMFLCQMSSATYFSNETSLIPGAQLFVATNHKHFYLVCPKYIFTYSDGLHLDNVSYRRLGEYYGKAMKKVLVDKQPWKPLMPIKIDRVGTQITAKFHVPVAPLVFDTTAVLAKANHGFEYYDSTQSASISLVEIVAPDTVRVTLNQVPTGTNQMLAYAHRGVSASGAGANVAGSIRGNLRDSDATVGPTGVPLRNWSVQFIHSIPFHPLTDDGDLDGLADQWENYHFGSTTAVTSSNADFDGDGQSNGAEWLGGSDPTRNSDYFGIRNLQKVGNDLTLSWYAAEGRLYTVECSSDLSPTSWLPLSTVVGTDEMYETTLSVSSGCSFFRVRAEINE